MRFIGGSIDSESRPAVMQGSIAEGNSVGRTLLSDAFDFDLS